MTVGPWELWRKAWWQWKMQDGEPVAFIRRDPPVDSPLPRYEGYEVMRGRMRIPIAADALRDIMDPTGHDQGDEDRS